VARYLYGLPRFQLSVDLLGQICQCTPQAADLFVRFGRRALRLFEPFNLALEFADRLLKG
jgi:hypothetical protein